MSGALVDLVAIGVQDTYLTGDPQTTYFRQAYKRHTNFAMEPVRQIVEGDRAVGGWSQVNVTRNGDLLTDLYFLADFIGDTQISCPYSEVQLYIGGQQIDTITAEETAAMAHLFPINTSQTLKAGSNPFGTTSGVWSLGFFFGRAFSCALPLCALQYHDVTLRIKWRTIANGGTDGTCTLYADYVQLDTAERNAFASKPLTMLIEQHQRTPIDAITASGYASLEFSHPVKALYSNVFNTADGVLCDDGFMKLSFNGKDRTPSLPIGNYFADYQQSKHTEFTGIAGFAMYSFALYANRVTPTGSCNFSRLDNARLEVTDAGTGGAGGNIYALNWNFLKIENGMGGLLFAN